MEIKITDMVQEKIYNYFERNPQLHVLFIFDRMNINYTELEQVTWPDNYVYKVFDGAWFNTKYAIENTWKDKNIVLLFTDGTYPHTEEQMLKFPLLDMLKANMEFKEDDYESFMQQYNLPEKFRLFIKNNVSEIQSTKVSSLLAGHLTPETFSEDLVCRAFVSSYLGDKKLLDWEPIIVRMLILGMQSEEKKRNDFYHRLNKNLDAKKAVDAKLKRIFDRSYNPNSDQKMKEIAECLKYNSITQLLDVVTGDNYKEYKIKNPMMLEGQNKLYEYGLQSRQWAEKFNQAMIELGKDIKEEVIIAAYGVDAQYNYMPEALCWPILKELLEKKLVSEPDEVNNRMRNMALKFSAQSDVQVVIKFVELVALYYEKVRNVGTMKLNSPEEYIQKYIDKDNGLYLVDMIYRQSLEAYHDLITKDNPIEQTINDVKNQLDQEYAKLSNILNLEWLTCVLEREDLFESLSIGKQEDFFNKESEPSAKQVIIISDALRYEVAAELMQELSKEKHIAKLFPYRAMLPTETKYCKTALLPHRTLEIQGNEMMIDGQVLVTTEQRTAHLARYREGAVCVKYEDVMNGDQSSNRELFKRPLVYIFHDVIDENSHPQNPFEIIRSCRTAVNQLSALVKRLHATMNVANVVVTADHGFIYNDIRFEEKDKHSISDSSIEKKTRYYLTDSTMKVDGIVKMPLEKVSGISSSKQLYVAVPIGTNRLAAPGGYNFAHGGATLQEMIIPVVKSSLRRTDKTEKVGVSLMNHNLNMVSSRLKFHLIQSEAVSMTVMERKIVCQVFNGDDPVTIEKELLLNSTDSANLNNRVFEVTLNLSKSVTSSVLQLRVYDVDDKLNPLIKETVKNNTMIEQDF
jgi:hypothetical protein